jgi:hypothetical protein
MSIKLPERQLTMFELIFSDQLDSHHELMRAANLIDRDSLHEALEKHYSLPVGRQVGPYFTILSGFQRTISIKRTYFLG